MIDFAIVFYIFFKYRHQITMLCTLKGTHCAHKCKNSFLSSGFMRSLLVIFICLFAWPSSARLSLHSSTVFSNFYFCESFASFFNTAHLPATLARIMKDLITENLEVHIFLHHKFLCFKIFYSNSKTYSGFPEQFVSLSYHLFIL